MKKVFLLSLFVIGVVVSGCRMWGWGVRGNGHVKEETRTIEEFREIQVSGAFSVKVDVGDEPSLSISCEENLLKYIRTYVKGNTLYIDTRKSISPRKEIKIYLTTTELNRVESSGANSIYVEGINSDEFDVELSGACSMDASGKAGRLDVEVSGAGHFDSKDLKAEDVTVSVSGAASSNVYASESLRASVSGVGTINFYGDPKRVKTNVSGVGSINRR